MNPTKAFLSLVIVTVSVLCLQAKAGETPEARTCREYGGRSWVVNFAGGNNGDDKTLCFFGAAAIGAEEFADFKWNQVRSESVAAAQNSTPGQGGAAACSRHDAQYRVATDSNERSWGLCQFNDGSVLEVSTLARGSNASANASLVSALR